MKIQILLLGSVLALATMGPSSCKPSDVQTTVELADSDWTPPQTKIDPQYVETARRLLGNGLADPRDGTFCVETVEDIQRLMDRHIIRQKYGWLSPDRKWLNGLDGLITPINGKVEPANLEAALKDLLSRPKPPPFGLEPAAITPATQAVVLISGNEKLAEEISLPDLNRRTPDSGLYDYLSLRYKGIAHQDLPLGRDRDGLSAASYWVRVLKIQEADKTSTIDRKDELSQASDLFVDFERRGSHGPTPKFDPQSIAKLDKPERIATLIEDLADAKPPINNPGGAAWMMEPICMALAAQGGDAIPPLIDAVEHDCRLTRGVAYRVLGEEDPGQSIRVSSAEWFAIQEIWPSAVRYVNPDLTPNPSALRAAWAKEGSMSDAEQWLDLLHDDQADPRLWVQACERLQRPSNEIRVGPSTFTPKEKGPMVGAELTASQQAEVTALMASRALQMQKPTSGVNVGDALRIAHLSYKWSKPNSLPCLQTITQLVVSQLVNNRETANLRVNLCEGFGVAIADRLTLNDSSAVKDYAEFAPYVEAGQWFTSPGFFAPLWTEPNDPGIRLIGAKYMENWATKFDSPDPNAWRTYIDSATGTLAGSPLLQFRPYRQLLIRAIENTAPAGQVAIVERGRRDVAECKMGSQTVTNWNVPEGSELPAGTHNSISVGDYAAQNLVQYVKGIPTFFAAFPKPKREQSRKAIVGWLNDDKRDWSAVAKASPFCSTAS